MKTTNRWPVPYSNFIEKNFNVISHSCGVSSPCFKFGGTEHFKLIQGTLQDSEQLRHMLATWQAFRTPNRGGIYLMDKWKNDIQSITQKVSPLDGTTIFCDWDKDFIEQTYDQIKKMLFDSVVCTTKTMHCINPDLFIILDRQQVYDPWRAFTAFNYSYFLPKEIRDMSGKNYVDLMIMIRTKLVDSIERRYAPFPDKYPNTITDINTLRYMSPIRPANQNRVLPNTLCKVFDNIMAGSPFDL